MSCGSYRAIALADNISRQHCFIDLATVRRWTTSHGRRYRRQPDSGEWYHADSVGSGAFAPAQAGNDRVGRPVFSRHVDAEQIVYIGFSFHGSSLRTEKLGRIMPSSSMSPRRCRDLKSRTHKGQSRVRTDIICYSRLTCTCRMRHVRVNAESPIMPHVHGKRARAGQFMKSDAA